MTGLKTFGRTAVRVSAVLGFIAVLACGSLVSPRRT